jgi:hypothetical protein
MKPKSLNESMWTSYITLFIQIGAKRSKNGKNSTALTVSDFTKLTADQWHYMDIFTSSFTKVGQQMWKV